MARVGRSRVRPWMLVVAGLIVVLLVVPATFAIVTWRRIGRVDVSLPGSSSGGTTYLLVGSDSRTDLTSAADKASFGDSTQSPGQHADMIMLVRVPADGTRPRVLAVPRDLLVFVKQQGLGRLGASFNDGPQVLVDSLCRTLGIGVDHLATVDFLSFAHLVDAVGGVDVTLPYHERDTVLNFDYDAGVHHLDGQSALTYVRVRHVEQYRDGTWQPDPDNGLGRSTRARDVLAQIGADAPGLSDPFGFARFAWVAAGALSVDQGSGFGAVRGLEHALRSVGDAKELQLPVTFRDGTVPVAKLLPDSVPVLRRLQPPARTGPCADPELPVADGQVLHPNR